MQKLINEIQNINSRNSYNFIYYIMCYVGLNILIIIISKLKIYVISIYQMEVSHILNKKIMQKSKELSLKDFESKETYNILRRAQNESLNTCFNLFKTTTNILSQITGIFSLIILISMWKPHIIIFIIIMPIISTIYTANVGYKKYKIELSRTNERRQITYVNYIMTNDIAYKEITVYRLADYFINIFQMINKNIIKKDKEILNNQTQVGILLDIIDEIIGAYIIYIIMVSTIIGEILIGDTILYINSLSNIHNSLISLLNAIIAIYQESLYVEQLFKFFEYDSCNKNNGKIKVNEISTIEIKNLTYKYDTRKDYALTNINLYIRKGEILSLVGKNGSGKTTLVKILCGFYNDYEGEILINGINLIHLDIV